MTSQIVECFRERKYQNFVIFYYNFHYYYSDSGTGDADSSKSNVPEENIISITGRKENCEGARDAFLALVPLTMEVELPNEFHRLLIGQNGQFLRDLMKKYMVILEKSCRRHYLLLNCVIRFSGFRHCSRQVEKT